MTSPNLGFSDSICHASLPQVFYSWVTKHFTPALCDVTYEYSLKCSIFLPLAVTKICPPPTHTNLHFFRNKLLKHFELLEKFR